MSDLSFQRRFPRYEVAGVECAQAQLGDLTNNIWLWTLSEGGCSFLSTEALMELTPPNIAPIQLMWRISDKKISFLQGKAIYVRPITRPEMSLFQYGIEFVDAPTDWHPVLAHLAALSRSGIVNLA